MDIRRLASTLACLLPLTCASSDSQPAAATLAPVVEPAVGPVLSPPTAIDTDAVPDFELTAADEGPLPFYKLDATTYMFFGRVAQLDQVNRGFNGNAGFVVTDEGVFVIDCLGTPKLGRRALATIRTVTDKPVRHLVITHNHPDHYYGAVAFADIPGLQIYAHPGLLEYIESDAMAGSVAYRVERIPQDMVGFVPVKPTVEVGGEMFGKVSVVLGGRHFDIYNTGKHHSHGDLVVHQREAKILWISDLAFNRRVTFIADGNSERILSGHDWLASTFPGLRLMVPGHGSAQTSPFPMVSNTRAYIEQLRAKMLKAVEADINMQQAVETSDMPEWEHVMLYEENHRKNANFVYREMQWEAF